MKLKNFAMNNKIKKAMNHYDLSKREIQILTFLVKGYTNAEIAKELELGEVTIKAHFRKIFKKLNVNSRVQTILKIFEEDILGINRQIIKY